MTLVCFGFGSIALVFFIAVVMFAAFIAFMAFIAFTAFTGLVAFMAFTAFIAFEAGMACTLKGRQRNLRAKYLLLSCYSGAKQSDKHDDTHSECMNQLKNYSHVH